jgi:dihydroorotase
MKKLLKGGRVVDPVNGRDGVFDILIDGGTIARVGRDLPVDGATVVEVPAGLVVVPGLIDMHVHLREPGQEHKETVATGTASAVAGGFTAVACMPNTSPVNDSATVTSLILAKAAAANLARVYPIGAVSKGQKGELLADIAELKAAGCVAITDDGHPTATALLLRRALEYAGMFGIPVVEHCEDPTLKGDGVAHEGFHASRLGLRGIPGACEALGVERGVRVTCEVTPHHFVLTDESLAAPVPYDTNVKMNPPLREITDRDSMIAGIADGSVDVIASDHAPHDEDEKRVVFDRAPFGIVGLETAVPLVFDRLVRPGHITLGRMVELLSVNPAKILGVPGGTLAEGAAADITVLAPDLEVSIVAARLHSKSKNTPFDGWELRGGVAATIVGGNAVYVNDSAGFRL